MTAAERGSQSLEIEKMYVDVGATSREEVEQEYGVHIGDTDGCTDVLFLL